MSEPDDREGAPEPYADRTPFRAAKTDPLVQRAIPVAKELPGYRAPTARRDLLAGVTVAALAIPSAMAYAELAGLPAVAGLYALLLPTLAYAFLAIITAAITSTFVARATAERDAAAQESEDRADELLDSRLVELSQRMDRLEQLLIKVNEGLPRVRP